MNSIRHQRPKLDRMLKRCFDVIVAAVALAILSPVILLVALAIRWTMGAPVIFRQQRAGYRERPFTLAKFRTMREARDASGKVLPDAARLTWLGRWLRTTSLDELPQLWNILRGDMSLVGPRPLLLRYLDRYTPEQRRRHEVMPGITGWAQVHGRNQLTWEEKFAYDIWYVDHGSFGLDLWILFKTLGKAVIPRGISAKDHATMPEFLGPSRDGLHHSTHTGQAPAARP